MGQANVTEFQSVTSRRSPVGRLWRWRSEIGLLSGGGAGVAESAHCVGLVPAAIAFGGSAVLAAVLPWPRRYLVGRFWSLVSRHRLQSVWWQMRLHNRAGRLPLVLWIRPTRVGERAWVLCLAGLCADDFRKAVPEMASACAAREVRVTVSRRFAPLVTIDVIRRDLLGPGKIVPSRFPGTAVVVPAVAEWLAVPDDEPVPETVPPASGWPEIPFEAE